MDRPDGKPHSEMRGPESQVPLMPGRAPPPDYYADNVQYLLHEVEQRSADLLGPEERLLLRGLRAVSAEARRLFARLVTRRGPWIRIDSLRYPEVADLERALDELEAQNMLRRSSPVPADVLLGLLTRAEHRELFPGIRAARKAEWIVACVQRYSDPAIRRRVAARHPWIEATGRRALAVCQVLFFGSEGGDLSTLVVQDLGILRFEDYPLSRDTRLFRDRPELDRYLLCRRLSAWSKRLDESPALADLIERILEAPARTRTEQRVRDRVLNRVANWHERRGALQRAAGCYRRSTSHPARERLARVLHSLGDDRAVEAVLSEMRAVPWGPEEEDFAQRFPGRRPPSSFAVTTRTLHGATPAAIERHAMTLLTSDGGRAWHLENLLPLGLAGLCFWDAVFMPVAGAFSHPFQLGPHDLLWPDFAARRRDVLARRIDRLRAPGTLAAELRRTVAEKRGVANRLVHWGVWDDALVDGLLAGVPHAALLALAVYTVNHLARARTGFPDLLLVYGPDAWELVEVKGPTDQLQPAQRVWLRVLADLGLPARVLRFRRGC